MKMMRYIFMLSLYVAVSTSQDQTPNLPATCSMASLLTSEIQQDFFEGAARSSRKVSLTLDKGEAACVRFDIPLDSSRGTSNQTVFEEGNRTISILHVILYSNFHQSHPIAHRYTFGIPYLRSQCTCDCPGGESRCTPDWQYGGCLSDSTPGRGICSRTYHPNQAANGCSTSDGYSGASACCEVVASAYKGWKFVAVDISQPTTFGELSYRVYHNSTGKWKLITTKAYQVPLDKLTQMAPEDGPISRLRVTSSRPFRDLHSGMYFYQENDSWPKSALRMGPALNRVSEWSQTKLGWFRFNTTKSTWYMDKAAASVQQMLQLKVSNCKEQRYAESFQAGYYIPDLDKPDLGESKEDLDDRINSYIGRPITEREVWLVSAFASLDGRYITVTHRDPPSVVVDFQVNASMDAFRFIHHSSHFEDFRAEVRLDAWSNRYLRLILSNCLGVLSGTVYENENFKSEIVPFTTPSCTANSGREEEFLIGMPGSVNKSKYVCLKTGSNPADVKCIWAEYKATPILGIDNSMNRWIKKRGDCDGCNEDSTTWSNFFQYLHPGQWLNGISGAPEWLAFAVETGFYMIIIVLVIAVCRRLLCPIVKWALCKSTGAPEKE